MTSSDPTKRRRSVNVVLLALACLAGCSVAPPLPLADDPDLSQECLPAGERFDWRLGVASTDQVHVAGDHPSDRARSPRLGDDDGGRLRRRPRGHGLGHPDPDRLPERGRRRLR